jgi:hypothetical protein
MDDLDQRCGTGDYSEIVGASQGQPLASSETDAF